MKTTKNCVQIPIGKPRHIEMTRRGQTVRIEIYNYINLYKRTIFKEKQKKLVDTSRMGY